MAICGKTAEELGFDDAQAWSSVCTRVDIYSGSMHAYMYYTRAHTNTDMCMSHLWVHARPQAVQLMVAKGDSQRELVLCKATPNAAETGGSLQVTT